MEPVEIERHESGLGAWIHASWSPSAGTKLHGSIRSIWYFDGVLLARRQRVFPDGFIEIVVQLDEAHRPGDRADADRFPPVCITGLRLGAEVVVAPPGRCRVLGLVLSPPCAHLVMRDSLAALTGITADLHAVAGHDAGELAERVHGAVAPAMAIAIAREWVWRRLERTTPKKATFRDVFGTTPKRYERVLRFRDALDMLARGTHALADIADAHGYYDQAHFTNDFREHSGMTPSAYLRMRAFPGGPSLADA